MTNNLLSNYQNKVLILDGNHMAARAQHANPDLHTLDGTLTGCLFTSLNIVRSLVKTFNPTRVIVAWDMGHSEARKLIYPDYKISRKKGIMDAEAKFALDNYYWQLKRIREYLDCLPVSQLIFKGVEGDDIIGQLCKLAVENGTAEDIVVVSSDKDFLQLVSCGIVVYDPIKLEIMDRDYIKNRFGVSADDFLIYKSILGDSSDDISGIKGVGSAAAVTLVGEGVRMLSDIKERAMRTKGKKYDSVVEEFHIIERNYKLMDLFNLAGHLSQAIRDSIRQVYEPVPYYIKKDPIMRMSFKDEMVSIYTDVTKWVIPFRRLAGEE